MSVTINNAHSKVESLILYAIFLICGGLGVLLIGLRLPLPIFAKVLIIVGAFALWLLPLIKVKKYRGEGKGSLVIDVESGTFSLNGSNYQSYSELTSYSASTIGGNSYFTPYSSMYITLGSGEARIKMNDDEASKTLNEEQKQALIMLVDGSGLSSEEKESFNGWLMRCNIKAS